MSSKNIKEKIRALNKATESFRQTKKKTISRICAPAAKHRLLLYPLLVVAFFYILFANIAFYLSLWVILNRKKAIVIAACFAAAILLLILRPNLNITGKSNLEKTNNLYEQKDTAISWFDEFDVDFDGLIATNSDIVGWLYFENEDISYPIVQGSINEEYMDVSYDKSEDKRGSIALASENSSDFNDFYSVIYGKDCLDRSMFGKLSKYKKADYYSGHEFFQIITPQYKYRYEIVACKNVSGDDDIYNVANADSIGKANFVSGTLMKDSLLNIGIVVSSSDHFVTLSPYPEENAQFVVCAKRVSTKTK